MSLLGTGADHHDDRRKNAMGSSYNPTSPASISDPLLGTVSGYGGAAAFSVFGWDCYNGGYRDSRRDRYPVTRDPGKSQAMDQHPQAHFAPRLKEVTKKSRQSLKQEVSKLEIVQAEESSSCTLLTRNHYELLRQHRSNLINEVQETEMMLSVYIQQQNQREARHQSSRNEQEPSEGAPTGSDHMKRPASETKGHDGTTAKKACPESRKGVKQGTSSDPTHFTR